jgi:hypothetical protein
MSTATKKSPVETRVRDATIPNLISLAPAPCRMIVVEVYEHKDKESHSVAWFDVIGFLCVVRTFYSKLGTEESFDDRAPTHAEMLKEGWYSQGSPEYDVYPVITGGEVGLVSVLDNSICDRCDNRVGREVIPCHWPPNDDRQNAIRVGKELIDKSSSGSKWAILDKEEPTNV